MRFSTRDLIWLTIVAAVMVGWGVDHGRIEKELRQHGPVTVVLDELRKDLPAGHKMEVTYDENGWMSARIVPIPMPINKSN